MVAGWVGLACVFLCRLPTNRMTLINQSDGQQNPTKLGVGWRPEIVRWSFYPSNHVRGMLSRKSEIRSGTDGVCGRWREQYERVDTLKPTTASTQLRKKNTEQTHEIMLRHLHGQNDNIYPRLGRAVCNVPAIIPREDDEFCCLRELCTRVSEIRSGVGGWQNTGWFSH